MPKKKLIGTTEAVTTFHVMAGQPVRQEPVVPDIKAVRFREHFMLEEVIEGLEALCHKDSLTMQRTVALLKQAQEKWNELQAEDLDVDFEEYADSLTDRMYVTEGTGLYFGIPMPESFHECHEKNMTRFPATQEELDATLAKADAEGVEVEYLWNEDYQRFAVLRKDNGKLYKSANYVKPDFAPILGLAK